MKNKFLGVLIFLSVFMVFTKVEAASLKFNSRGNSVITIQQLLINKGYLKIKSPTNYFGNLTKTAVIAFQTANGLTPDGIVGPKTLALLNNSLKTGACTPDWQCGWGQCSGGYQGMTTIDSNNCGIQYQGNPPIACPALARMCN